MSATSKIEWTDRTWNPLTGCTKVSPGCDNCYAKTMHERFNGPGSFDTVKIHPDRMHQPLSWRKPSLVFVNSMSDLFHKDVPDRYVAKVFAVMAAAPKHTFQVLTKRHARMKSLLSSDAFASLVADYYESLMISRGATVWTLHMPLPNVWMGVSVESQQWANLRIPALLHTPAAVRFLSCEPLLGPIDLRPALARVRPSDDDFGNASRVPANRLLHWVIAGGESGQGARPMQPDWARTLRDQCQLAGIAFHFKQHGAFAWNSDETHARRVGKKAAGRELDGRTWDEYPERAA